MLERIGGRAETEAAAAGEVSAGDGAPQLH
jgi:hypothetical protein